MRNQLKSVQIKKFKAIKDSPFDCDDVNVLIGANNSGKSSILQALHFGIGLLQTVQLENKWQNKDVLSISLSPNQLIYTPCEDLYALGEGGRMIEKENSSIEINLTLKTGDTCNISVRKGRIKNIIIKVTNTQVAKSLSILENPFTIFSPGLAGIAKNEQYVSDGVLLRIIARGDANLVLRNILLRLWEKKESSSKWDTFINDICQIFPDIQFDVYFNSKSDEYIRVMVNKDNGAVPLELSGTGVLQTVQILSYIHYFSPSVIVLDEPDSHLHPNNQRLLCKLLRNVSEERETQIIMSTHSRHVVDALSGMASFLWVREGTVDRASTGDDLSILLDIGALDVKELVTNTKTKCVVLTEDEIKQNLKILLEASFFNLDQTVVLAYYGCTVPHNLRPLIEVIRNSNSGAKIVIHRDRDYLNEDEANDWAKKIREMGAEPFLTTGVDVESHFLNKDHLAVLNNYSVDEFDNLLNQSTLQVADTSIQKYVNGRCDIEKKAGTYGKLDVGKLAVEASREIDANPIRFRHSKTVLKKLRELYRKQTNNNLIIAKKTEYSSVPELVTIAKKTFRIQTHVEANTIQ